jgi:DNA mismatch endonuclease (patch repair protein)
MARWSNPVQPEALMARRRQPKTRSQLMASVRQRDTKPEQRLREALWAAGCRYRKQARLPGRPDLAFPGACLAVFVDGCYWHGCPRHYSSPTTNRAFWIEKLRANDERDQRKDAELAALGWRVLHVWECEIKTEIEAVVARVQRALGRRGEPPVLADGEPAWPRTWFSCACGSADVQVFAVTGPGSLNVRATRRPESASLRCRTCGIRFDAAVGGSP